MLQLNDHTCIKCNRGGETPRTASHPTLHYRYGGLNTAKLRHCMKVAHTANCLLCGQLDGGHHSMSGCLHMSGMYTERHNVGGRILLKTLLQGAGLMHDSGHAAHISDSACPNLAPTYGGWFASIIPDWVHTKGREKQMGQVLTRPDLLIAGA
jgi:hypothetical protein